MKQFRLLTLLVLLMTAATGAWADGKTVDFPIGNDGNTGWGGSMTRNGIKIQANGSNALFDNSHPTAIFECWEGEEYVTFTISMEDGSDILGVSMTLSGDYIGSFQNLEGWTGSEATRTWSGNAKSVNLRVNGSSEETINLEVTAISVTVPAAAEPGKYTVTMAENTVDKDNWTISPTEAAEGETVTLQYNGRLKVKGVKATSDAAPAAPAGNPAPTTAAIDAYTGGAFAWDGDGSAATGLPTINTFAANDKISILSAKNTNTQFTTSAGGASATFSGTATDDSKFYAVYPYTAGLTLSGDVISGVVIPTSQWNSGWIGDSDFSGWDPKAPIAYAITTGSSLTFHNACAILKVTFPKAGTFGRFTISANEPLAGTFSLDTSTGTLTPTSGSTTVTVGNPSDIYSGINSDFNGKTVYVAIAPGTYTGFNLHIYNEDDDEKSITKSTSVTFEAGKIYDLGSYNLGNL